MCCQTEQASQAMNGRLSFRLVLPQIQRISSSSSSSSASTSGSVAFLVAFPLAAFAAFGFGAGDDDAFLCWPLFARTERRGSSAHESVSLVASQHQHSTGYLPRAVQPKDRLLHGEGAGAYLQTCFHAFLVDSGVEQRLDD